jgi:type II secretory pathway pseudopilin PulG
MLISFKNKHSFKKGDTLVEVLFATAVFSLIAVGSMSIMNQGLALSQRSLEITLTRNQMDSQSEMLRFFNNAYIAKHSTGESDQSITSDGGPAAEWLNVSKNIIGLTGSVSDYSSSSSTCPSPNLNTSFIINAQAGKAYKLNLANYNSQPYSYSQVMYGGASQIQSTQGIWIEGVRGKYNVQSGGNTIKTQYIDFHIRTCWYAISSSNPAELGTIVRLYEPSN